MLENILPDQEHLRQFLLPVLIFFIRIIDVSLGTMRIIFVSRGMKILSVFFGFIEVLIWLFAIGQIMQNLTNVTNYIAYAAGFASGNFVGIYLESRLAVGFLLLRIITEKDATDLTDYLRSEDFGVTTVAARGLSGKVRIIFSVIKRKDLKDLLSAVQKFNPHAFISIEDVRSVSHGIFPAGPIKDRYSRLLRYPQKGK